MLADRVIHIRMHLYYTVIQTVHYYLNFNPAYVGPGLDVGPSLAQQVRDLGVTLISGYDQGGVFILSETKRERGIYNTL